MGQIVLIDDFEIEVTRKRIKNINVRIKPPDGRIIASLPFRASVAELEQFVRERKDWIIATRHSIRNAPPSMAEAASPAEIEEWRAIVEAFVPALIEKWEPVIGVRASKVVYRNMKSRWGSCQPATGRICINTRLALYPPECLEYVVVHELCHLRERGHGPRFYALMDRYLPNHRAIKKKLT